MVGDSLPWKTAKYAKTVIWYVGKERRMTNLVVRRRLHPGLDRLIR
jgi:hypothetical protein